MESESIYVEYIYVEHIYLNMYIKHNMFKYISCIYEYIYAALVYISKQRSTG